MIRITEIELANNLDYYLELSSGEDIYVTRGNEIISVLTNPEQKNFVEFLKLKGCLSNGYNGDCYDDVVGEEILKKCGC